mgnify:CR=1 FL=1
MRFYRTYKINDEGEELLAAVFADSEDDAETEFESEYPSSEGVEIVWTSPIFEKLVATADNKTSCIRQNCL